MQRLRYLLTLCRLVVAGALLCAMSPLVFAEPLRPPAFFPAGGPMDPTADPPQAEPMPVQKEYDRFQDKTTIKVEGIRPAITRGDSRIFINATSSCDGIEMTGKPEKIALNLLAVSDEFQYADLRDNLQFILLINNNRVRVP